jgi:hypothetical protein
LRVAEVVIYIAKGEAVLGQHGSACCTRHQLARSTQAYASPFGPPKGHQVLVYSTLAATLFLFLYAECSFVCLVRRLPHVRL